MQKLAHQTRSFDGFTLDLTRGCLLRGDEEIKLRPKSFGVLKYLTENSGRLVSKDELIQAVWQDTFVTDNSLVQCLTEIRRAIGNEEHRLKTVPRRGYIFDVPVIKDEALTSGALYTEEIEGLKLVIEEERDAEDEETTKPRAPAPLPQISSAWTTWTPSRKVLAFALLIISLASAVAYFLTHSKPKQVEIIARPPATVAVLPFKPLNKNSQDEYLELGMADALITKLSNLKQIIVRPTSAVRKYAGQEQDLTTAGRELQVESVLEGSIQKLNDRIRVTVQLVSVGDRRPLWAETFDEKFTDIFAVQDSISERVAGALALQLTGADKQRLTKRYTENVEAYQLYLKGRYFWNKRGAEDLQKAIGYFEQAIEKDPSYALAYAGLSDSYGPLGYWGYLPPKVAASKMKPAAVKAVELDDTLAEAHTSLGGLELFYEWDWPAVEREFKRAFELNPNYPLAHQWYSVYLLAVKGEMGAGIAERKRALELDPLSLPISSILGYLYYLARRYDEAIDQCRKSLELDPNFAYAHEYLGSAYEQKGMYAEAVDEYLKAETLSGVPAREVTALREAYRLSGWRGYCRKRLDQLQRQARTDYVKPSEIARFFLRLGEKDQAFEWLEKAYEEHDPLVIYLNVDPIYDSLRSDARLQELLRRMRLTP